MSQYLSSKVSIVSLSELSQFGDFSHQCTDLTIARDHCFILLHPTSEVLMVDAVPIPLLGKRSFLAFHSPIVLRSIAALVRSKGSGRALHSV